MANAAVFTNVSIYPHQPHFTLIEWQLHPEFNPDGYYEFDVQYSRSGHSDETDWTTLGTVVDKTGVMFSLKENKQRQFSNFGLWFYRIKLRTSDGTYYSDVYSSLGSLGRQDYLVFKEVMRQECLSMYKKAGSRGFLLRRKHWGQRSSNVSEDTYEILDPNSTDDYGTGFVGGYWKPFPYWVTLRAGDTKKTVNTQLGTNNNETMFGRGLAYPLPRTDDVWVECDTGNRYYIGQVTVTSRIRHLPIIVTIELKKAPTSDIIYSYPVENNPTEPDTIDVSDHWHGLHWI